MNINQLMKQAQNMQKKLMEAQSQVEEMEVSGASGGGMVKITINGKGHAKSIEIAPELINPSEKDILEDLIIAAINDANSKKEDEASKRMADLTGGLQLPPGFKMPF
ncbi:MAG: YbaB/EbfC family nucleoid-associated protein [Rickettsiales bacterium]|nr:YbaB/EbfC family nucleoid-associated protein [Rickettsiales bacterium]